MNRYCRCGGNLYCKERHPTSDLECEKCGEVYTHCSPYIRFKESNYNRVIKMNIYQLADELNDLVYGGYPNKEDILKWLKEESK